MNGKGVAIFNVEHDGENVANPPDACVIQAGDRLFCYGDHERIHALKNTGDMKAFRTAMKKCRAKQQQTPGGFGCTITAATRLTRADIPPRTLQKT